MSLTENKILEIVVGADGVENPLVSTAPKILVEFSFIEKNSLINRRQILIVAVWILISVIWGANWLFLKIGLRDLPPLTFAGARTLIAALVMTLYVTFRGAPLPRERRNWCLIAVTGFLMFGFNYALMFWGTQHISSGLAALLNSTIPIFGFLLAHLFLPDERLSPAKIFGIAVGFAGVALIFSHQFEAKSSLFFLGGAAILLSSLMAAVANILIKLHGSNLDHSLLITGQMWFGFASLSVMALFSEGNPLNFRWTAPAFLALGYLALVGSILAFVMYYWLVGQIGVTRTMLIYLILPLVAVFLGTFVLNEPLTWRIVLSGAAVIAGVGLIVTRKKKQPKADLQSQG